MQTTGNTLEVQHLHFVAHPAILQQNRYTFDSTDALHQLQAASAFMQAFVITLLSYRLNHPSTWVP
eukprot:scaffold39682_cov17-Tisochrysis_lutea.AAC.1